MGLVEVTNRPYQTLPDDEIICLTKCYIAEKDQHEWNFNFVRRWLKIDQTNEVPFTLVENTKPTEAYKEWTINTKDQYIEWIRKNLEALEAIDSISHITDREVLLSNLTNIKENKELQEYLESRGWYKNNLPLTECKKRLSDLREDFSDFVRKVNSLIDSYGTKFSKEDLNEILKEVKQDIENHDKILSNIKVLLNIISSEPNQDMLVQEFFNSNEVLDS